MITVTVSASDGHGGITAATSTGTIVGNMAPSNTVLLIITGTPSIENKLSTSTGT